jgi:hypothetical protein
LASHIASNLSAYPQFDGVFLDDVWYSISASDFHQEGTSDDPNLPSDLVANWKASMVAILSAVKAQIGVHLLFINGGIFEQSYIDIVDGLMDENFAHANWEGPNEYLSTSSWLNHLNAFSNIVSQSKYFLAQSGITDGATQDQIVKTMRYSFSSFLLGIPPSNTFAKHYFCPSLTYSNYYWYQDWEVDLGEPRVAGYNISGTNLYRRDFENGIVLVNPLDGIVNTEIDLPAREGIILLNEYAAELAPNPPTGLRILK